LALVTHLGGMTSLGKFALDSLRMIGRNKHMRRRG
jgi:hypothetical protein